MYGIWISIDWNNPQCNRSVRLCSALTCRFVACLEYCKVTFCHPLFQAELLKEILEFEKINQVLCILLNIRFANGGMAFFSGFLGLISFFC